VENWSLALDVMILWKTWPGVARGVPFPPEAPAED